MRVWRVLAAMLYIALLILGAWAIVSYIDIIWDNYLPNPTHFKWNLFVLMTSL